MQFEKFQFSKKDVKFFINSSSVHLSKTPTFSLDTALFLKGVRLKTLTSSSNKSRGGKRFKPEVKSKIVKEKLRKFDGILTGIVLGRKDVVVVTIGILFKKKLLR